MNNSDFVDQTVLKVWRPCQWKHEHMDLTSHGPLEDANIQECIYTWNSLENLFGSLIGADDTELLSDSLSATFAPDRPVEDRAVNKLTHVVHLLDQMLGDAVKSSWTETTETVTTPRGGRVNLRQHTIRSLRHHIQWIVDIFKDVPGACITLR